MSTVPSHAVPTRRRPSPVTLVDRFRLVTLIEACLAVEDGVAGAKDVEVAMMTGAGLMPGPFTQADSEGLDDVVGKLEMAAADRGEHLSPPATLRRLVAQGRLGMKSGQGFFPYPRPDEGQSRETVLLETRDDVAIAWLNRPPTNFISPQLVRELGEVWEEVDGQARVLVIASSTIFTFSGGADVKAFSELDPQEGKELLERGHELLRGFRESSTVTIASVGAPALGGGSEIALACDLRIASKSAYFGQPEVNLGLVPGFGATQRLPRLIGRSKADQLMLVGQPIDAEEALEHGLVHDVVPDLDLWDVTLSWARKLAQAPPLAVRDIKRVSGADDVEAGLEAEREAFMRAFRSEDAREGISAFLDKRQPEFTGR